MRAERTILLMRERETHPRMHDWHCRERRDLKYYRTLTPTMFRPYGRLRLGSITCLLYGRPVVVGGVAREPILVDACFGPGALTDAARPRRRIDLHHF